MSRIKHSKEKEMERDMMYGGTLSGGYEEPAPAMTTGTVLTPGVENAQYTWPNPTPEEIRSSWGKIATGYQIYVDSKPIVQQGSLTQRNDKQMSEQEMKEDLYRMTQEKWEREKPHLKEYKFKMWEAPVDDPQSAEEEGEDEPMEEEAEEKKALKELSDFSKLFSNKKEEKPRYKPWMSQGQTNRAVKSGRAWANPNDDVDEPYDRPLSQEDEEFEFFRGIDDMKRSSL